MATKKKSTKPAEKITDIQNSASANLKPSKSIPSKDLSTKAKSTGRSPKNYADYPTPDAKGKRLVIVESPSKAKTINKYLGKEFTVFASVGHIKELPKKEIGLDFEHHYEPRYETIAGKEKVVRDMKKLAKESVEIMIATDPDREGEAIAWHIANEVAESHKPTSRVLFNEITQKAVREAIEKPREIDFKLVRSQQARQALDKIVGYKVSPFLWETVLRGLSAGRVQSVALRLICERESEIDAFKPKEYWSIYADFTTKNGDVITAKLIKIKGKEVALENETDAREALEQIKKEFFSILEIKKRKVRRNPPSPFTTSLLQQASSNQLGYGSKQTMRLAQQLYEGIELGGEGATGLITYMRTDSKRIGKEAQTEARDFITRYFGNDFVPPTAAQFKTSDSAQDAHEAIRPTSVDRTPKSMEKFLTKEQFRLYDLIWKRFVASQMTSAELEQTSVDISDNRSQFLFRATGSVILFEGFLKVFGDSTELDYEEKKSTKDDDTEEEKGSILPKNLFEKDILSLSNLKENQHFTKPPARYSEASLVKELDNFGIGRPSTYASILSTLVERTYVENRSRRLYPTDLGKDVSRILVANFAELFNTDFTAKMEGDLDKVASGETDYEKLLDGFYIPFEKALGLRLRDPILPQNSNAEVCDLCNEGRMIVKWTKSGKFLGCSRYPKCKNIKSLAVKKAAPLESGVHCHKCETGRLVVRIGKFGKFLSCTNYPTCDGILNLDKAGHISPPKTPPLQTDIECPKCKTAMYLRDSKRGLWFSCPRFPKCRGTRSWKSVGEEMGEEIQTKYESLYREHEKQHAPVSIFMLDGTPLDLRIKLEDLVSIYNEQNLTENVEPNSPVTVDSAENNDAPF